MTQDELIEHCKKAQAAFRALTPEERFAWLVSQGFINSRGELTKRCGGDAELEPHALETLTRKKID